jgi:folate-dependent tRNA-U54 methylase TrmFO/GidA
MLAGMTPMNANLMLRFLKISSNKKSLNFYNFTVPALHKKPIQQKTDFRQDRQDTILLAAYIKKK